VGVFAAVEVFAEAPQLAAVDLFAARHRFFYSAVATD